MAEEKKSVCPHCKLEVDPKASKCPHCQGKIYQWTLAKKALVGVFALFFVLMFMGAAFGNPSPSAQPQTSAAPVTPSGLVKMGQEGRIHISSSGDVPVMISQALLDKYIHAATINDTEGMTQIIASGGGFFISDNTKVKVLDGSATEDHVRILNGDQAGQTGWVPMEFVKP